MEQVVVTTPEGEIHGRRFDGEGPSAVLLHGGPGMSASYLDPLVPLLAGVFSPILYQQRGLLPTTVDEPFTVETNVADAEAVIARRAPRGDGGVRQAARGTLDRRRAGAFRGDRSGGGGGHVDRRGVDGGAAHGLAVLLCRSADGSSDAGHRARGAGVRGDDGVGQRARGGGDACPPAVPAEIPVLFVHGAASPMPVRASTESAKLIPHAEVEVIEGAGHFVWHERPDEVRDVVRAFVARSSS